MTGPLRGFWLESHSEYLANADKKGASCSSEGGLVITHMCMWQGDSRAQRG